MTAHPCALKLAQLTAKVSTLRRGSVPTVCFLPSGKSILAPLPGGPVWPPCCGTPSRWKLPDGMPRCGSAPASPLPTPAVF